MEYQEYQYIAAELVRRIERKKRQLSGDVSERNRKYIEQEIKDLTAYDAQVRRLCDDYRRRISELNYCLLAEMRLNSILEGVVLKLELPGEQAEELRGLVEQIKAVRGHGK